mmetsp:Transcript_34032/g.78539  ORF Transcript_34032/g.78539 Transcript_34032/m.78539 type:complete len:98 (+) Transcript_34032:1410-1703(+)
MKNWCWKRNCHNMVSCVLQKNILHQDFWKGFDEQRMLKDGLKDLLGWQGELERPKFNVTIDKGGALAGSIDICTEAERSGSRQGRDILRAQGPEVCL